MNRRDFCRFTSLGILASQGLTAATRALEGRPPGGIRVAPLRPAEDLFSHIHRLKGRFDPDLYRQLIGAANPFKEGDAIVGVAAADEGSRVRARRLLGATLIQDLEACPIFPDTLYRSLQEDLPVAPGPGLGNLTLDQLRVRLLAEDPEALKPLLACLGSDVIACVVKLMSNAELTRIGQRFCTPLPGTRLGARGYLGARIQPNSPTDHPEEIIWQVLSGWSYAVGDLVLGTNPAGSEPEAVAKVEAALLDLIRTFGLETVLPHSVLAHVDLQAELEAKAPDTTGIWFQSLAGSTSANATFDVTLEKLQRHADTRAGQYGFYFETGQGADFTNGHGHGTDMVVHEARKYGLIRLLTRRVAQAQARAGREPAPWVHVNDVAGFIGPEVFRNKEQLVRCCLEDLAMGKLHGLTIGLDVCATLHMDLTLEDLDWCQEQVVPANPAYLIALPTKNDPMLGYLSSAFQDHVRLRERFGTRVNDPMWAFFKRLGVIDDMGRPTAHFGQPLWVWLRYRRAKGDSRPEAEIEAQGRERMAAVRRRGVPLAEGHGREIWDLTPALEREVQGLFVDAKNCLRAGLAPAFIASLPGSRRLKSQSQDRFDYIQHPHTGEVLDAASRRRLRALARPWTDPQVLVLVSDGLNAHALMDPGHLSPFLATLYPELERLGLRRLPVLPVVEGGRVRVGYRMGEDLFGASPATSMRAVIHLIGERPGSMHHTFSAYLTAAPAAIWSRAGTVDHNITRLVSDISDTTLDPVTAARDTIRILAKLWGAEKQL